MKEFLLVDDHVVVRTGLGLMIQQYFQPCTITEAGHGQEALDKLKEKSFNLMVLDIHMPDTDALGLTEYVRAQYPNMRILIYSMGAEHIYAKRFLKAGASGFVSKEAPLEEIIRAVTLVLDGRKYISEELAMSLANETESSKKNDNPFNKLSAREFEIATLLLSGKTISEISRDISIQISTVGTHKARLFEKLGVTNILELKELANSYHL